MKALSSTEKLDAVNIGLMLVSCLVAFIVPFELFLFSYAILGPLHYLTEISWLHDKQYYSKKRYDGYVLLGIGILITLAYFANDLGLSFPQNTSLYLIYFALLAGILFAFVKSIFTRIAGLMLILITAGISKYYALFFIVFLPTLIHVYIFTGLFMLYGALKSKSRLGIVAVVALALCPVLLVVLFPDSNPFGITQYGRTAYIGGESMQGFWNLNMHGLNKFFGVPERQINTQEDLNYWFTAIFSSKSGILLMRFIAFAYTYHYLNWFSKTRVIQWHNVPKLRFAGVIVLWLASVAIYIYDYSVGLQWLFFLSFAHVLLEFPLNATSVAGIGNYFRQRYFGSGNGKNAAQPKPQRA